MPLTMAAFTLGSLGMIGVPPMAGFISKWYLGTGGLIAGKPWVIAILVASSLLNAAYFLPILHRGRLVGRLDPKADRKAKIMRIRALYLEPGQVISGELVADGSSVVVWVDYAAGRASPLPEALKERIRSFDGLGG